MVINVENPQAIRHAEAEVYSTLGSCSGKRQCRAASTCISLPLVLFPLCLRFVHSMSSFYFRYFLLLFPLRYNGVSQRAVVGTPKGRSGDVKGP